MCDTKLKGSSDYGPFEQKKSGTEIEGGAVPMAEEKKGIFARLFGQQQKSGSCCNMRIVEITEEDEDKTPPQGRPEGHGSSCCAPAPEVQETGGSASRDRTD
jgi:hypothetical protein